MFGHKNWNSESELFNMLVELNCQRENTLRLDRTSKRTDELPARVQVRLRLDGTKAKASINMKTFAKRTLKDLVHPTDEMLRNFMTASDEDFVIDDEQLYDGIPDELCPLGVVESRRLQEEIRIASDIFEPGSKVEDEDDMFGDVEAQKSDPFDQKSKSKCNDEPPKSSDQDKLTFYFMAKKGSRTKGRQTLNHEPGPFPGLCKFEYMGALVRDAKIQLDRDIKIVENVCKETFVFEPVIEEPVVVKSELPDEEENPCTMELDTYISSMLMDCTGDTSGLAVSTVVDEMDVPLVPHVTHQLNLLNVSETWTNNPLTSRISQPNEEPNIMRTDGNGLICTGRRF